MIHKIIRIIWAVGMVVSLLSIPVRILTNTATVENTLGMALMGFLFSIFYLMFSDLVGE